MRPSKTVLLVPLAFGSLAAWQGREYRNERDLIRRTLARQGDSVMHSLVSGIRSHRWLGPFIREQLPDTLEELSRSPDILAVAVVPQNNGYQRMAAGAVGLVDEHLTPGHYWNEDSYCLVTSFHLDPGVRAGMGRGAEVLEVPGE